MPSPTLLYAPQSLSRCKCRLTAPNWIGAPSENRKSIVLMATQLHLAERGDSIAAFPKPHKHWRNH